LNAVPLEFEAYYKPLDDIRYGNLGAIRDRDFSKLLVSDEGPYSTELDFYYIIYYGSL
jgi:hypothetical protein